MSHCLRRLKTFHAILPSLFALLLLSLTTAQSLLAQAGGASISGEISDKSGAVIRGAEVDITNTETNIKLVTMSNNAGVYNFPSLPPGNYVLSVHKQGFRSVDIPGIAVYTQDDLERNLTLEVGSVSESVTVTPTTTNESPSVSLTISREFVEDTPLNGRSFQDLIQLAPGAVSASNGNGLYSINGQRTDANNFTVDGVSANLGGIVNNANGTQEPGQSLAGSLPAQTALGTTQSLSSVDSLQEFKIQTSGYSAEFGRNPGGQVQFTTRSGTNQLHGTLSEYLRNTDFDANSYSNNYFGVPKSAEHQNDFGGTLGGPLLIPHLYDGKNRTFYFLSYEGLRLLLPAYESEYNPTQALRDWASPSVLPFLNSAPLPNPGVPGNQDGCTIPDPTTGQPTACDAEFYASYSYPDNLNNYSIRLDQDFGRRFHGFIRYADTPSSESSGGEQVNNSVINVHNWTAGLTATVSSALIDEFRFNFTHDGEQSGNTQRPFHGSIPLPRNLLIPADYDTPYASTAGVIEVPGSALFMENYNYDNIGTNQHQYQIIDSLTWTKGAQSFKFGADWRRLTPQYIANPYESVMDILDLNDMQQGYASYQEIEATAPGSPVFDNLSLYVQDHWRMSPRFSLDCGLRWDFNPPPGPSNGHYPVVLTSGDLSNATLASPDTQPYQTDYHSFAPRIGFAWNAVPTQSHALTIRAGFGFFFDTAQQAIGAAYAGHYPFGAQGPLESHVPLPLSGSVLVPPSLNVPLTPPYPALYGVSDPNLTSPYTEQWNLSMDVALNPKNTLTASYVGNVGRKLLFTQSYSNVPDNSNFTSIEVTGNAAKSSYNSLQVQDVGRIINGLDIVASFTLAHALDNASTDSGSYAPLYGNSDNDLRRVLGVAINYQSPGVGLSHLLHSVTSGWTFANRFSIQSGSPLNITQAIVTVPNGATDLYVPDRIPGISLYLHGSAADLNGKPVPGNWRLNRSAFACTTDGATSGDCSGTPLRQGTLGRNYVRTPSFWALNTALQRSFPIHEQVHLNFRADAFNILNHPNLAQIDTGLSDSTFGASNGYAVSIGSPNQLYGMGAARSLQLSLKLQF
jgi:hypothetical protein